EPGSYFRDLTGKLHYVPKEGDQNEGLVSGPAAGLIRGLGTVAEPAANLLTAPMGPGEASQLGSAIKVGNEIADVQPHGIGYGLGRFVGEAVPTTLAIAGTEGAASPVVGETAIGRFLLGKAGGAGLPGRALQGASLASRGA